MEETILGIIRSFAFKKKIPFFLYGDFLKVLERYAERREDNNLRELVFNEREKLRPILLALNEKGKIKIMFRGDRIDGIELPTLYTDYLMREYKKILNDPGIPFPGSDKTEIVFPEDKVLSINVKTDLVSVLNEFQGIEEEIIRINFPEGIDDILVPTALVRKVLIECAVMKIHRYLQDSRNSGFIFNKLMTIMQKQEVILNEMMNDIITKPRKAFSSLMNPTTIGFKFWAHLASFVLQDLKDKTDKLIDEIGYIQSAYLLGFFIVYQKGLVQKAMERKEDLSSLESQIKKSPYVFSATDLYDLRDRHGVKYVKKYSPEFITNFISEKTKAKEGELPEVLRLKGSKNKEYFIHRDLLLPVFLEKVAEAANEIKTDILEEWIALLKEDKKIKEMKDDTDFLNSLIKRVKDSYPLLTALMNPNLLYIAKEELSVDYPVLNTVNSYFNGTKLKPVNVILGLYRKALLREAKAALPVWQTIPVLKNIVKFFIRLFKGKKKQTISGLGDEAGETAPSGIDMGVGGKKKPGGERSGLKASSRTSGSGSRYEVARSAKSGMSRVRYLNAMKALKEEFLGDASSINKRLDELAEKWNPLFDPVAKKNLVEDVNALIRDFLRSLKRGFRVKPPNAERIRNLAAQLAMNKNLEKIKKKEYLKEYIALYMIKYLSDIKW